MPVYLKLDDIKGESRVDDMQLIELIAVDHEITSDFDRVTSRLGTTRRMNPLVVTKPHDVTSVLLLDSYAKTTVFKTCEILFYDFADTGQPVKIMQIALQNAQIIAHRMEVPNRFYPENAELPPLERIAFVYSNIIWTGRKGETAVMSAK